jgi:hypothetical protein
VVAAHFVVKLWRTLALAVVVGALGVYLYIVERPRVTDEAAGDSLINLQPKDVASVTLLYPSSPAIRVEREGDNWQLREPVAFPADDVVVERLLDQIAETKVERRIKTEKAQSFATYGLEGNGEQARISFTTSTDTKIPDVIVGRTTPVGYSAFARVEGADDIVLTPLLLHTGIKKTVLELRKKRLFEVDAQQVVAMRIDDAGRAVELERRGDEWIIKSPIESRADPEQVRDLVSALNEMEALDFFDAPPSDYVATDTSALAFRATLATGGDVGFRLGKSVESTPPGRYLERSSDRLLVKIEEAAKLRFSKDVNTLRDKRLYRCSSDDAASIRFERDDGGSFALERNGDAWTLKPAMENATVRDAAVRRAVGALVTLAGKDVAMNDAKSESDLAAFGLDVPVNEVEILKADGSSCGRAMTGIKGADSASAAYYVKRSDDGLVMTLPSYLFSRIDLRRDDLVDRKPDPAVPPSAPTAVDTP